MSLDLNKVGRHVKNEKFCAHLKKTILELWRCKKDIYPSTVPVLLNRDDLYRFENYEYFITSYIKEKHIQLFFFRDYYNKNIAVICDKLFNFYKVTIECVEDVYLNTLFDCQIKEINGDYLLYLNDCVCMHGNNIKNMSFEYRLSAVETFLNTNILLADQSILFKQKIFYKLRDVSDYIDEVTRFNLDASTGLLFVPNNLPLICGTQRSNLYWLQNNDYTIDLAVVEDQENTDSLLLECYNLKNKFKYAKVTGQTLINKIKALENYKPGCITEFKIVNKTLEPTMVKLDKIYPNGLRVIEMVLYTINENITIEEIKNIQNVK